MKRLFFSQLFLIAGLALLSLGTVRKNEDVVTATTQTGPISLQQKMEEEKDGKKGAPSPSMTFYPNSKFLTTPAVEGQKIKTQEPTAAQETSKTAVEDEENWWSEGEEDSFSPKEKEPRS